MCDWFTAIYDQKLYSNKNTLTVIYIKGVLNIF